MDKINLVKLCVGADTVEDLAQWQTTPRAHGPDGLPRHITRMWPKQDKALLNGGALYWVIKGQIQARQTILRLDEVTGADGIKRCALVLDPTITRCAPVPKRPFQGWRYLKPEDAPPDLRQSQSQEQHIPEDLSRALADIGVL